MVSFAGEGYKRGRVERPCKICGELIQFLPTTKAPKGAWINADDGQHHRCPERSMSPEEAHIRSILLEA